jgi:hypothetical protein
MQTGGGFKTELSEIKKKLKENDKFGPNMLHFAYVFASPLVIEITKGSLVEDKLDEISFK